MAAAAAPVLLHQGRHVNRIKVWVNGESDVDGVWASDVVAFGAMSDRVMIHPPPVKHTNPQPVASARPNSNSAANRACNTTRPCCLSVHHICYRLPRLRFVLILLVILLQLRPFRWRRQPRRPRRRRRRLRRRARLRRFLLPSQALPLPLQLLQRLLHVICKGFGACGCCFVQGLALCCQEVRLGCCGLHAGQGAGGDGCDGDCEVGCLACG